MRYFGFALLFIGLVGLVGPAVVIVVMYAPPEVKLAASWIIASITVTVVGANILKGKL